MRNAIVNRKQILINIYLRDAQKLFVLSVKTSYISVWGFCFPYITYFKTDICKLIKANPVFYKVGFSGILFLLYKYSVDF